MSHHSVPLGYRRATVELDGQLHNTIPIKTDLYNSSWTSLPPLRHEIHQQEVHQHEVRHFFWSSVGDLQMTSRSEDLMIGQTFGVLYILWSFPQKVSCNTEGPVDVL